MGKVPVQIRKRKSRQPLKHARIQDAVQDKFEGLEGVLDTQHLLISTLLPPAVKMFIEQCEHEVDQLCGSRCKHGKTNQRWGKQKGSIILANHQSDREPQLADRGGYAPSEAMEKLRTLPTLVGYLLPCFGKEDEKNPRACKSSRTLDETAITD